MKTIELIGAGASVEVLPVVKGKELSALSSSPGLFSVTFTIEMNAK